MPILRIIKSNKSKKIIPFDYNIISKLDGEEFKSGVEKLTGKNKKILYHNLGYTLGKLHSIHFKSLGEIGNKNGPKNLKRGLFRTLKDYSQN